MRTVTSDFSTQGMSREFSVGRAATAARRPNFFIAGAAKAGTTSLAKYLAQHPDIFMPSHLHEPAFFAEHTGCEQLDAYLEDFAAAGNEAMVGEKSGAYLYDADAANRIREFDQDAKIIIVLRNPVEMAHSLYWHNRREGFEPILSFQEALAVEDDRVRDSDFPHSSLGYYANFLYRRRATYAPQLERYYEAFAAEQIFLLRFDDLKTGPLEQCQSLFRFLGVDPTFCPDLARENVGGGMHFQFLQNAYVRNAAFRTTVMNTVPQWLRRFVYRINRKAEPLPKLTDTERKTYLEMFADDLRQLEGDYGISLA
jgi:hypothetical protein